MEIYDVNNDGRDYTDTTIMASMSGDTLQDAVRKKSCYCKVKAKTSVLCQEFFNHLTDAPGGFSEELDEFTWALGAEYVYQDSFALRAGYFNENEF